MEWWLIPIGLGLAVLARLLWVAAFHPGETVSSVPELDGYTPGERSDTKAAHEPENETPSGGASTSGPATASDEEIAPELAAVDTAGDAGAGVAARPDVTSLGAAGEDEIWIELDIEPLFSSSETSRLIDLTEEQDPEATP